MTLFVESLKRLYTKGLISTAKLDDLQVSGKITEEEYAYIIEGI